MENNFTKGKIVPSTYESMKAKIIKVCEDHKIRLTPSELDELTMDYLNKFVFNISITDLIRLGEYVVRRNG